MKVSFEIDWRLALRWLIGVVLIWAALGKLANLQEVFTMLLAYRLPLPAVLLRAVAIVLPWIELLCGLLLIANMRVNAALAWAVILFVTFTLCTGQAWMRGLHIACGCLDLRLVGIRPETEMAELLESVGFALVRALTLACAGLWLLRLQLKSNTTT